MPPHPRVEKKKHVNYNVMQKLELIGKLERAGKVCEVYSVTKQTVSILEKSRAGHPLIFL